MSHSKLFRHWYTKQDVSYRYNGHKVTWKRVDPRQSGRTDSLVILSDPTGGLDRVSTHTQI